MVLAYTQPLPLGQVGGEQSQSAVALARHPYGPLHSAIPHRAQAGGAHGVLSMQWKHGHVVFPGGRGPKAAVALIMCVIKIKATAAMATVCTARAAPRALAPPSQRVLEPMLLPLNQVARLI